MPRDADVKADRLRAFYDDGLRNNRERLLRASKRGEPARRVDRLAVEILDVRDDVRRAPRDAAVAPERDDRGTRKRRAADVELPGGHVGQIPDRRDSCSEVRIVGEQRLARGRERPVHDPVVRCRRLSAHSAR